jgi:CO/xanthine dehydrogenase FAD-binding subunit
MILEYNRPGTIEEAIGLISRKLPKTIPIGGGTDLDLISIKSDIAVVDLQNLSMDRIDMVGNNIKIGSGAHLQELVDQIYIPESLKKALTKEVGLNKRNAATLGGTIIACDGRSSFITALVAMDAILEWLPGDEKVSIGHYLALRHDWQSGVILNSIYLPCGANVKCAATSRSPADSPILCVAVCQWSSGRTRVALGGYGLYPILAFDGPEETGSVLAAAAAFKNAGDEWASADYRSSVAARLVKRLVGESGRMA